MREKPDKKVKEREARRARERLISGLSDDARAHGRVPDTKAIESVADEVVGEQIHRHEEMFANGIPETLAAPTIAEPRPLPDGVARTSEHLGTFNWDTNTNTFTPVGELSPRLKKKLAAAPIGDPLLERRFKLIAEKYPGRLEAAWFEGMQHACHRMSMGLPMTVQEMHSLAADFMMVVVEETSAVLGDWRGVAPAEPKIIIAR